MMKNSNLKFSYNLGPDILYNSGEGGIPFFFNLKTKEVSVGVLGEPHIDMEEFIELEESRDFYEQSSFDAKRDLMGRYIKDKKMYYGRISDSKDRIYFWVPSYLGDMNEQNLIDCVFALQMEGEVINNPIIRFGYENTSYKFHQLVNMQDTEASLKYSWKSKITKEQAFLMVNKRVVVNSYAIKNKEGAVKQYLPMSHHFWVYMDEPYTTRSGKLANWHKCNAGDCTLADQGKKEASLNSLAWKVVPEDGSQWIGRKVKLSLFKNSEDSDFFEEYFADYKNSDELEKHEGSYANIIEVSNYDDTVASDPDNPSPPHMEDLEEEIFNNSFFDIMFEDGFEADDIPGDFLLLLDPIESSLKFHSWKMIPEISEEDLLNKLQAWDSNNRNNVEDSNIGFYNDVIIVTQEQANNIITKLKELYPRSTSNVAFNSNFIYCVGLRSVLGENMCDLFEVEILSDQKINFNELEAGIDTSIINNVLRKTTTSQKLAGIQDAWSYILIYYKHNPITGGWQHKKEEGITSFDATLEKAKKIGNDLDGTHVTLIQRFPKSNVDKIKNDIIYLNNPQYHYWNNAVMIPFEKELVDNKDMWNF